MHVGVAFKRRAAGMGRLTSGVDFSVSVKMCGSKSSLPSVGRLDRTCRISHSAIFGTFLSLGREKVVSSAPKGKCCIIKELGGMLLLLSRCSPFGCTLCGDFMGHLSVHCGISLLFRRCGRHLFGAVVHRSLKQCGGCVIVGFSGRGLSPGLCGVGPSGLLLLSFNGFRGRKFSCIYRSFSRKFCGTLFRLTSQLEGCRGLIFILMSSDVRPQDDHSFFREFYTSRRLNYRIIDSVRKLRIHEKRICVTVHRVSMMDVVGGDEIRKLRYKISFNLVKCGSAPTCRIVSRKVATLDIS